MLICQSVNDGSVWTDWRRVWTEQLDKKVRELYDIVCRLEDEKYDWEMKLIRQNAEVVTTTCTPLQY